MPNKFNLGDHVMGRHEDKIVYGTIWSKETEDGGKVFYMVMEDVSGIYYYLPESVLSKAGEKRWMNMGN